MLPMIEVRQLSKLYRLGQVGAGSLREDLRRLWRFLRGKSADPVAEANIIGGTGTNGGWVRALDAVSFSVAPGERVGIIGKNGAGKSTLLKILSRITAPSSGEAVIRGRMASLLEVGTGFHPDFTGRENVYLNGALLGMSRQEIGAKFDDIVRFSGVGRYIDTPVKRYSSGMRVRLGFAVAAHLEPDVLIVDEVLAVGDAEFQEKALGKMGEVSAKGDRTILFVSHNMNAIRNICSRCIVLDCGRIVFDGDVGDGIDKYVDICKAVIGGRNQLIHSRKPGEMIITKTVLLDNSGYNVDRLVIGEVYRFVMQIRVDNYISGSNFIIAVKKPDGTVAFSMKSVPQDSFVMSADSFCVEFEWCNVLSPGEYLVYFHIRKNKERIDRVEGMSFEVTDKATFKGFTPNPGLFQVFSKATYSKAIDNNFSVAGCASQEKE